MFLYFICYALIDIAEHVSIDNLQLDQNIII